jgi:hypothetical protein
LTIVRLKSKVEGNKRESLKWHKEYMTQELGHLVF